MPLRLRRPSPATVIASLALFVAAGGPAEAARLINGKTIKKGTVRSKQIKDRTLGTHDLSRSAYARLRAVPERSVGPLQLAPGAVGPAALALNGVTGANVADGTLGTADLADDAVTGAKIATNTIRQGNIGAGAVGASEVAAGAIRGSEIADGTVAGADVADASLTATDLAGARGTATLSVPALLTGACHAQTVETPAGLADDHLLVTPQREDWPATLTLSAVVLSDTAFQVAVCNLGAEIAEPFGDVALRYLGLQP